MTEIGRKGTREFEGKVWDGSQWVWPENLREQTWWDRHGVGVMVMVGVVLVTGLLGVAAYYVGRDWL